ncbi:hypothetical protein ACIBI9_64110 [Nonomuraea sp. NPDC050451]|uniref:hypothetical protein n=1 Tax=Nonomuraea sp. NPDC050451 TaxID=3364364 RepID=UPI0037B002CB
MNVSSKQNLRPCDDPEPDEPASPERLVAGHLLEFCWWSKRSGEEKGRSSLMAGTFDRP